MKPFNLEKALAGHPLVMANGQHFEGRLFDTKDGSDRPVIGKFNKYQSQPSSFGYDGAFKPVVVDQAWAKNFNLFMQDDPATGTVLARNWMLYLISIAAPLECESGDGSWIRYDSSFGFNCVCRIPLPKRKFRNKRPDELPYVFEVKLEDDDYTYAGHRDSNLENWIPKWAARNLTYTTNGVTFHPFTVEVSA